jgi:hypothetical protein
MNEMDYNQLLLENTIKEPAVEGLLIENGYNKDFSGLRK